MTVKSGLIALSVLALVTLVMLVSSDDEAYRWVEQSPGPPASPSSSRRWA